MVEKTDDHQDDRPEKMTKNLARREVIFFDFSARTLGELLDRKLLDRKLLDLYWKANFCQISKYRKLLRGARRPCSRSRSSSRAHSIGFR